MIDAAEDQQVPQIYLITPPEIELSRFPSLLSGIMDEVEIACVRLAMAAADEDEVSRAADVLRETCHARDIPLILDTHVRLVEKLGLDGVHLNDGARTVRFARKELGADVVVGAACGASRHEGMNAGESGADYVALGPTSDTGLGAGELAAIEDFQWWSEMIELPIVAEGGITVETVEQFAPFADFFAIGPEIWKSDTPLDALKALVAPLS
ncbi:thiamine phosphate synthase [uncultured Litoreibacter sp.]|uniref:thiamine phosphate synthase n=1 Tax=uncultured Litoreibacter sp. TaxID=1392394 RepID=UPI0026363CCC|nr:thiamine phosphate synthase [uncultured Litoreibacter sp.]